MSQHREGRAGDARDPIPASAPGDAGADERVAAVQRILAREGIEGTVLATGHAGDVAALAVAPEHLERLAELAPEVKALGFRYVAVELRDATGP